MQPIHIPEEWHDDALLTFDQFCELTNTPPRTVRGWRRRVGPEWCRFEGCGRLHITVAEVRRFVSGAFPCEDVAEHIQPQGRS